MKSRFIVLIVLFAGLVTMCGPAFAHHGGAVYDTKNPLALKGTITAFDFVNPHVQIYFDVKNDKGEIVHWACETISPGKLVRGSGWSKDVLKPGDQVTVVLAPAKASTHRLEGCERSSSQMERIDADGERAVVLSWNGRSGFRRTDTCLSTATLPRRAGTGKSACRTKTLSLRPFGAQDRFLCAIEPGAMPQAGYLRRFQRHARICADRKEQIW